MIKATLTVTLLMLVAVVSAGTSNDTSVNSDTEKITEGDATTNDVGTSRFGHHYLLPFYGGSAVRKFDFLPFLC